MNFIVEPSLLDAARTGSAEAQYQVGLQAFTEGRFGFARIFFRLAHEKNYPLAEYYYQLAQDSEYGIEPEHIPPSCKS